MKPQRMLIALILLFSTLPVFAQVDTAWVKKIDYANQEGVYGAGRLLAVDKAGNIYLGADGNPVCCTKRYVIAKYNSCGDTLWVKRVGNSAQDIPRALAVDDSGYVYVTGHNLTATGQNYFTVKFSPAGDTLWKKEFSGTQTSLHDNPTDIAVDKNRNVIVTGWSPGASGNFDYATVKYAPNGDTVWVRRYDSGLGNPGDGAKAMAVDTAGNVYVTGFGGSTNADYVTIKYSPSGSILWTKSYAGPYGIDDPSDLAVDAGGNVYVTGRSLGLGTSATDFATVKYAPNGDTLWVRRYASPGDSSDEATAMEVDPAGNVYVTGTSASNWTIVKYDASGNTVWVRNYALGSPNSLALDKNGNIYVTGNSNTGIRTAMFNPANGDTVWTRQYSYGTTSVNEVVVDTAGNVYVGGNSGNSADPDVTLIKYSSDPPCPPYYSANTPAGSNVYTQVYAELGVLFKNVSSPGVTSVTLSPTGPTPPGNFMLVPSNPAVYYDVQTTATYSDSVFVCFLYSDSAVVANEDSLHVLHYNGSSWVDVTFYKNPSMNQICSGSTSLSPFALAIPSACQARPGDANSSGTYTLADLIAILNYVFNRPGYPTCSANSSLCWLSGLVCRGDWNGSGTVSVADVVAGLHYLFVHPGGPWNPVANGACCQP